MLGPAALSSSMKTTCRTEGGGSVMTENPASKRERRESLLAPLAFPTSTAREKTVCVCKATRRDYLTVTHTHSHTLSSGCRTESCLQCRGGKEEEEEEKVVSSRQCDLLCFYQRETRRIRSWRQKEANMSNVLLRRNSSKQGLQNLMRYVVGPFRFLLLVSVCLLYTQKEAAQVNI